MPSFTSSAQASDLALVLFRQPLAHACGNCIKHMDGDRRDFFLWCITFPPALADCIETHPATTESNVSLTPILSPASVNTVHYFQRELPRSELDTAARALRNS